MSQFPKMNRKKMFAVATACMMLAVPAMAQDDEMEDLDLGELFNLDMEVTVASKKAEKLSDAPGMIVAYSADDMERMGYYTIRDLANVTTGYSSQYNVGEYTLETRGRKSAGFDNNKHLLLVDGIPVRHVRAGKVPVEEEMSLYGTKRVEFMKGPGSALYGAGAYSGVVSVVSQDLEENGVKASSQLTYGTDDNTKNAMGYMIAKNDNGQFRMSASYFEKETQGEDVINPDGIENHPDHLNYNDRNAVSLRTNYTHKSGLGIGFIYNKKTGGMGEFWGGGATIFNDITWETTIPYLKFNKDLTDVVSLNSYALVNQSTEKTYQDPGYLEIDSMEYTNPFTSELEKTAGDWAGTYERKMRDLELLAEANIDIDDIGTFIVGVNYDVRKNLEANGTTSGSWDYWNGVNVGPGWSPNWGPQGFTGLKESDLFNTISFYLQYQKEFPVLSGLKLTAGMREDISKAGKNKFSQFSPRVGLVQKFTDFLNWKVLYGTALRAPGVKEVGINNESKAKGTAGIPDLGAETIKSYETSFNFTFPKVATMLGAFYNETTNDIVGLKIGEEDVYENGSSVTTAWGIEVDVQAMPVKYAKLMAGGSFSEALQQDTLQQVAVPTGKINGGISLMSHTNIPVTVTPMFNYIVSYRNGGSVNDDDNIITDKNGKFATVDLNMDVYPIENIGIGIQIKNLANAEDYRPANHTGAFVKSEARSVNFSIKAKF